MGRHTKDDVEDGSPADESPRRDPRVGKVPLLPAVAGVVAVGAVVSAISTQQISLNFAGGPPSAPGGRSPQVDDSAPPDGRHGRHTARDDSSPSPRGGNRTSRGYGRTSVSVAFRTLATSPTGFQGQATITNHSRRPVNGWTLTFRYPGAKIFAVRDAREVRKGATLIVRNPAEHPSIAPGRTVRVSFTAAGAAALPTACRFNGKAC
jgi:hypothetical protein